MDLGEKITVLAGAAKYDASCASSGSGAASGGVGKGALGGKKFGVNVPLVNILNIVKVTECICVTKKGIYFSATSTG
jgi:predicted DNA-binding helix-hairpin-helix protein